MASITMTMSMLPTWFQRIDDRLAVLREIQVTRAYLLVDLKNAKSITCGTNEFAITPPSGADINYSLVPSTIPNAEWNDLNRTVSGGTAVRISTFLKTLTCSTVPASDADICIVLAKGAAVRRCKVAVRAAT